MGKPAIGGIKISHQLVLLNFHFNDALYGVPDLCRLFSDHRINLPFISVSKRDDGTRISVCVESDDAPSATKLVDSDPFLKTRYDITPRVGLFSIYPLKSSFEIFGRSLQALKEAGVVLHGLASSISSLAFLCDFDKLTQAVAAIGTHMELPPNHAPFLPEIRVKQSRIVKNDCP